MLKQHAPDNAHVARGYRGLGDVLLRSGRVQEAVAHLELALAQTLRVGTGRDRFGVRTRFQLAKGLSRTGQKARATELAQAALSLELLRDPGSEMAPRIQAFITTLPTSVAAVSTANSDGGHRLRGSGDG